MWLRLKVLLQYNYYILFGSIVYLNVGFFFLFFQFLIDCRIGSLCNKVVVKVLIDQNLFNNIEIIKQFFFRRLFQRKKDFSDLEIIIIFIGIYEDVWGVFVCLRGLLVFVLVFYDIISFFQVKVLYIVGEVKVINYYLFIIIYLLLFNSRY